MVKISMKKVLDTSSMKKLKAFSSKLLMTNKPAQGLDRMLKALRYQGKPKNGGSIELQ